jgi:serine/threonine protein kinase/tetratricopeptide (TPR) repeat protein
MNLPPNGDTLVSNRAEVSNLVEAWSIGRRELDHHTLIRPIGHGAMGAVFEARDNRTGRRVALKTLHLSDAEGIIALKREFRAVADVTHANLVLLHELLYDDNVLYFSMEYVDGIDFLKYVGARAIDWTERSDSASFGPSSTQTIRSHHDTTVSLGPDDRHDVGHFDERRLREALRQLALGVEALHDAGLVHLDLKPSNVLVERNGRVVILDFGLVEVVAQRRADARPNFRGTPAYMAPEQTMGRGGIAADWYAVGTMLFEALTGELPFPITAGASLLRKQREDAPRPSELVEGLPTDLEELCCTLLAREPESRPSSTEILDRLGVIRPSNRTSIFPSAPLPFNCLIGRDEERQLLMRAYRDSSQGEPVCILVEGSSGIGKTALIQSFLDQLRRGGRTLIVEGRCYERESVPYKAVDTLIDALAPRLATYIRPDLEDLPAILRAFPVLRSLTSFVVPVDTDTDVHELRQRAFRGLRALFGQLASQYRLVLAIDDLHWGDLDSARLLLELFAPPDAPAALLIGAYRADELKQSPFLVELMRSDIGLDIRLVKLSGLSPAQSKEVAHESGGTPFFIDSLVQHIAFTNDRASAPRTSIDQLVSGFLAILSQEERHLACIIAVAGQPISQGAALRAAGFAGDRHAVFAKLRSARVVRTRGTTDDDPVEIYHDRIRQCIRSQLGQEELASYHRDFARTLEADGRAEPDFLAQHFHAAGEWAAAGHYAVIAAERTASTLAFDRSADLYHLAVRCLPSDDTLRERHAAALEQAGRCAEAAERYLECARIASPDKALAFQRSAARQLLLAGRVDRGLAVLEPLLFHNRLEPLSSPLALRVTLAARVVRALLRGSRLKYKARREISRAARERIETAISAVDGLASIDPMRAASIMLKALELALDCGQAEHIAWALAQYALFRSSNGSDKAALEADELFAQAERLGWGSQDPRLDGAMMLARAKAALTLGDFRGALVQADACIEHLREKCRGSGTPVTIAQNVGLFALEKLGRLREMRERADANLRLAEAVGDLYSEVTARTYLAFSRLAGNDVHGGRAVLTEAQRRWSSRLFVFQSWLLLQTEVHFDLYAGSPHLAWSRLLRDWRALENSRLLGIQFLRIFARRLHGLTAVACLAAGNHKDRELIEAAADDARDLERQGKPYALAGAFSIRAGLALVEGDHSRAALELTRAASAYDRAGMTIDAGCARLRRAAIATHDRAAIEEAGRRLRACGVKEPLAFAQLHGHVSADPDVSP